MRKNILSFCALLFLCALPASATANSTAQVADDSQPTHQAQKTNYKIAARQETLIDSKWQFAFGNASDPVKDFGCGTEYFNYLTKAASIHNEGPYSPKFDSSKWRTVDLPFDFVVDLPFEAEASHSHGYKTVGFRYPATSVGWYRKTIQIPAEDKGLHYSLRFDGIFRDAKIWVNGFYLGCEPSGYASQVYDISEYLNYGGDNVIAVRADASLEEGWFYEGGGIYRHVWLTRTSPLHMAPFGTFIQTNLSDNFSKANISLETTLVNDALAVATNFSVRQTLYDASGNIVAKTESSATQQPIKPKQRLTLKQDMQVANPHLWSTSDPYMYKVVAEIVQDGKVVDSYTTPIGMRQIEFDADKGFILNGKQLKLKGVNMHQDHPGVGAAIPDALQVYRLKQLKAFGCNAYRASHNPLNPTLLDACDSLGILVIEENRLTGINDEHIRLLNRMIERDRNHPSIILWSVGNEEWGIEWNEWGERIAASMREYCHLADPTRPMTVATSGGPTIVVPADVAGYNYILQNPVEEHRRNYPKRCAVGSEETSGCGTRGIYFDDVENGHMKALNRTKTGPDSLYNAIERGWKFYNERPYLGGLFYWTGFDYRGEPNPLKFPATGSEFGILDYCGFMKDEAYYLKAWWTSEPVLHILPHWNLNGHEGEPIDVWVYSNCDEVELIVNGKKLGRQTMPKNGHLSWNAIYQPGYVKAIGYRNGKAVMTGRIETTSQASAIIATPNTTSLRADGRDVAVVNVELRDKKGRFVPTACSELQISVTGPVRILGVGNGDPAYQASERPEQPMDRTFHVKAFNGLAQILLQSTSNTGVANVKIASDSMKNASFTLNVVQ